jgi:allantoicase
MTDVAEPSFVSSSVNLSDSSLGSRVIFATDEWFATADNLLKPTPPHFNPTEFCSTGKVMDGWESRRRRLAGHDWSIIKLALPGTIHGFELDTAFFTGNYTPRFSIEIAELPSHCCGDDEAADSWIVNGTTRFARGSGVQGECESPEDIATASAQVSAIATWTTIIPMSTLLPGLPGTSRQFFTVPASHRLKRATHIRLNYYPDGGVARLRCFGLVVRDFTSELQNGSRDGSLELSSLLLGGRGLGQSNKHYGVPTNLLRKNRGVDMGDGWETARYLSRPAIIAIDPKTGLVDSDACDWCILRMACVVSDIEKLVIETTHFKGNFPESCHVEYCCFPSGGMDCSSLDSIESGKYPWKPLLKRTRLAADATFVYTPDQLESHGDITHLKVHMYPDGGLSRVRLFGKAKASIMDAENDSRL